MKNIVLDASVVIKWFKIENESQVKEARTLIVKHLEKLINIHIPSILYFELFNTIALDKNITSVDVSAVFDKLEALNLNTHNVNRALIISAADKVKKYSISFYDASYIALAERLEVDFITADKKLVRKVKLTFVKEF